MPPVVPSAACTELLMVCPAANVSAATIGEGCGAPSGQIAMKPGPVVLVTLILAATAFAVAGTPHCPTPGNTRGDCWARAGGPKGPVKPEPRVSASRQGDTATNGNGEVGRS